MKNPYLVMDISAEGATDQGVREGYLRQVRLHPPERDPQRFKDIRAAYEQVRTERARIHQSLLAVTDPDLRPLLAALSTPGQPPTYALFATLIQEGLSRFRLPQEGTTGGTTLEK